MSNTRVHTRVSVSNVRKLVRSLPAVLQGKAPDTHGFRRVFMAAFTREIYRLAYDSFNSRSQGIEYPYSDPWNPLKPSTIKRKKNLQRRGKLVGEPEEINVRTGRLREAFRPGSLVGATYFPTPDQYVVLFKDKLTVDIKVDYAKNALSLRPVWPEDLSPWLKIASQAAAEAVAKQIKEVIRNR